MRIKIDDEEIVAAVEAWLRGKVFYKIPPFSGELMVEDDGSIWFTAHINTDGEQTK